MALRFIIGRAGAGKTWSCLEEIRLKLRESPVGKPLIFIVPEQATFLNEMALASTPGLGGSIRAEVLSFRRLAWRVLQETGGLAQPRIGDLGKRMVLRQLLEKHKGDLQAFGKAATQLGFPDCVAEIMAEFKRYRITPELLEDTVKELKKDGDTGVICAKINDLALLYQGWEQFIKDRYVDPEDYLNILVDALPQAERLHQAEIWLDGFSGFTPQELAVLGTLMQFSAQINIALCLDEKYLDQSPYEDDPFFPVWHTYQKISQVGMSRGIEITAPLILTEPKRYALSPGLQHVERHFFTRPIKPFKGEQKAISLTAAANKRVEVEGVAREIIKLCRDQGVRWKDVGVLLRDLEGYRDLITTVFRSYGIPCFLDVKRSVMHHPLIELVRSALEVAGENWPYDAVFRYLKTDLIPGSRDEIDRLENYCLAHGIRGARWYDGKPWTLRRQYTLGEETELSAWEIEEIARVNVIKEQAVKELVNFVAKLEKNATVREICTAIFELLNQLNVSFTLTAWSRQAEAEGRLDEALEHTQIWNEVVEVLDQVVEVMGNEQITPGEFLKILDAGFTGIRLGLIPPGVDQVFVASLDRSRNPDLRVSFVLGVNDGVLPRRIQDDGVFTSREREILDQQGLVIAPSNRRRLFDEQYLVYIALTRPSENLYISYALADVEGNAMLPSLVIRHLKGVFPTLIEGYYPLEPPGQQEQDLEFVCGVNPTLLYLGNQLREAKNQRKITGVWWDVYNFTLQHPELRSKVQTMINALFYSNREEYVSAEISRRLYGKKIRTSVSRLEKFQACPFSHFSAYGLKLKERAEYRLGAPDLGQFFHEALRMVGEIVIREDKDWGDLAPEDCIKIIGEVVEYLAPKLQHELLLSTARYRYLIGKLRNIVTTAVLVLVEHARRGQFRPVGLEIPFGPGQHLPGLTLALDHGVELELEGRIDRIDGASTEERYFLRVIDYKSGRSGMDLTDLFHGLKMQLLAYLQVALSNAALIIKNPAEPAGMFYFTVQNPTIGHFGPMEEEQAKKALIKKLKLKGIALADPDAVHLTDHDLRGYSEIIPIGVKNDGGFMANSPGITPDQFKLLQRHLMHTLRDAGRKIMSGLITISPYKKGNFTVCSYCSFKPVCKFDTFIEENIFRTIKKKPPEEIWEKIRQRKEGE